MEGLLSTGPTPSSFKTFHKGGTEFLEHTNYLHNWSIQLEKPSEKIPLNLLACSYLPWIPLPPAPPYCERLRLLFRDGFLDYWGCFVRCETDLLTVWVNLDQNNTKKDCQSLTSLRWEGWLWWSNKSEKIWNIELGVNKKFVLGLPRAKQEGLELAKNQRRCERWRPPPPLSMSMLTDSMFFFWMLPLISCKIGITVFIILPWHNYQGYLKNKVLLSR